MLSLLRRPCQPVGHRCEQVVDAGMRVMRINFSHATFEEADKRLTNLRAVRSWVTLAFTLPA